MVTIPTSRDVGFNSARSGRIAPSGPTPMVGAAMAGLGQSLVKVGFDMKELQDREQADQMNNRGNEVSTSLTRFVADEEQRFLKAREEASESGIGFTRQFMEGHQQRANEFAKQNFNGMAPEQQTNYLNQIISRGNSLYEKANSYETQAKTSYYDRTTNTNLDTYRSQIVNNAADFGELKRQGLEAINSANMPEPWKAERRAAWEADAAESKWQWKFKQSPKEAIAQISAPVGGNVGRAYQRLISKGWTPTQAAGIVGNLVAESGSQLNTQARNSGDGSDGSDSIGIAQWNGARATALKDFAAAQGKDWHDIDVQTDFIDHELRTSERGAGENLARSQTAEDAAAAFVGYERPAGWSATNPRGAMHFDKRAAEARRIAGENPQAEDGDLDAIPFERRQQLANWGETQYSQQVTQQRAAAKDGYSLLIATQPDQMKESVILADPMLNDGDKAQLITSLRSAVKETGSVNAMIGALASGNVSINPFDADQTKAANGAYEKLMGAAQSDEDRNVVTSDFVARTGYIPKKVQSELRNGAMSTDPQRLAQAMEASIVLDKNAPASFQSFEGSDAVRKKMDLYRAFTQDMGYSSEEAAKRLIKSNDPEYVARRETLLKSKTIKDEVDKVDADAISSSFDAGIFSAAPRLGPSPAAEAAMVADYRAIYQEAIVDADGDTVAAKKATDARFQRSYGVSELSSMGGNVVVKNPPEKAYPVGADGTHAYIRAQLLADLKAEGIDASNVYLNPDLDTDKDIRAGRPPAYRVMYEKDGKLEMYPMPYAPDPEAEKVKVKEESVKVLQGAEQRMIENRNRAINERQAVDKALTETTGPAWMKARAAETATDQMNQQQTRDELGSRRANPGPIGGMSNEQQINDMINAGVSN